MKYHFYAVIIGTEILNGRRKDAHFEFVQSLLNSYGHTLYAVHIIKDDATLIKEIFTLIKNDPKSILFSFGGIGSTPDDLTRQIAADVFTGKPLERHQEFFDAIIERFKENAYPFRIHMADLPQKSALLSNPVNNMSGFSLENRYFFVPGFPNMAHPMIRQAVHQHITPAPLVHRQTLFASCSENDICHLMQDLPQDIELSSLPQLIDNKPHVSLSISGENQQSVEAIFDIFERFLKEKSIHYVLDDALQS